MRWKRPTAPILVATFALCLHGCGDDPTGPTDTSPPGIAAVTSVDVNHLQVTFSESVEESTAEEPGNYRIVEGTPAPVGPASPGDVVAVSAAVLELDAKTVMLTTSNPMQNLPYDLSVSGVADLAGNRVAGETSSPFTGSNAPDVTAPTIFSHTPAASAVNVPIGQIVVVEFSETMNYASVLAAFTWTSEAGAVAWEAHSRESAAFTFRPLEPLARNTNYTVTVGSAAHDEAGNPVASTSWSFRTTNQADLTPPTLVSSQPADGATHVPVASNLSMTFSEALQPNLDEILVTPDIVGDGVLEWSNGGRTFTFDPAVDLATDTQYSILIPPGGVKDLSGNGSVAPISIVFTTGTTLANGSIAGTLGGDPGSAGATDPAGAFVIASNRPPFADVDPNFVGVAFAGSGGAYTLARLVDDTYWTFAVKDANGDGRINPELGDAIGVYGVDFASQSGAPDSVTITGGSDARGIDFDLFDPMALSGHVFYEGSTYPCCYTFYVGVFASNGFDPDNPLASDPLYVTEGGVYMDYEWTINELDNGLQAGTYYVGAFMDVNNNSTPDPGDPMALFASGGVAVPVTVANGSDVLHIDIHLLDPVPGTSRALRPVAWPAAKPATPWQRAFRSLTSWVHEVAVQPRAAFAPQGGAPRERQTPEYRQVFGPEAPREP